MPLIGTPSRLFLLVFLMTLVTCWSTCSLPLSLFLVLLKVKCKIQIFCRCMILGLLHEALQCRWCVIGCLPLECSRLENIHDILKGYLIGCMALLNLRTYEIRGLLGSLFYGHQVLGRLLLPFCTHEVAIK